ncbi:MAG: hypothetical protein JWM21_345 [Acidobacteria bacterium]|nr:hypothetical protein [Acidobacteriota bacterium]
MKPWRIFKPDKKEIEREIEEQMRFHIDLLTQANLQQDMSAKEAKEAALRRFGNVEQIKDQCAQIHRRSQPLTRALKTLFLLLFLSGVLVRVFNTELHLTHLGDLLIAVPALGSLLLYVRSLNPSSFMAKSETSSPLMLSERTDLPIPAYDQRNLTPVERVISDR